MPGRCSKPVFTCLAGLLGVSTSLTQNALGTPEEFMITRTWTAPGGLSERRFGRTVAIQEHLIAISTDRGMDGDVIPGFVHLYDRRSSQDKPFATLQAPDRVWPDDFGSVLAFHQDQLLISAPGDAEFGWDTGSVWLFQEQQGDWKRLHRFQPPIQETGMRFGHAIAFDGPTVVIGAPRADTLDLDAGVVDVFARTATGWNATARLTAPDGEEADFFGSSVALWERWIAVGAWGDDDHGEKTGAVWLFHRDDAGWHPHSKLIPDDAHARDRFGYRVTFVDGALVISACGHQDNRGILYVYHYSDDAWRETQRLTDPQGTAGDWFGFSIAAHDDLLIAGSPGADGREELDGSIALFSRSKGAWTLNTRLQSSAPGEDQPIQFGWSVGTDGQRAVVGRIDDADGPPQPGRAWLLEAKGKHEHTARAAIDP